LKDGKWRNIQHADGSQQICEVIMNRNPDKPDQDKDKGTLEKLAEAIDPPGREISDDELIDPGKNIPDVKPDPARSGQKAGAETARR
jgi:hypothetical protein